MVEIITLLVCLLMAFFVAKSLKNNENYLEILRDKIADDLYELQKIEPIVVNTINNFTTYLNNFSLEQQKNNIKLNEVIKIYDLMNETLNKAKNAQEALSVQIEAKAAETIEFNEVVKLLMDHSQQRAIRILEFNELLKSFIEMIDSVSQNVSSMWIHDPSFKAFRMNLEEMIKQISYHQQESLQSIQLLFGENEEQK